MISLLLWILSVLIGGLRMHRSGVICGIVWNPKKVVAKYFFPLPNLCGNKPKRKIPVPYFRGKIHVFKFQIQGGREYVLYFLVVFGIFEDLRKELSIIIFWDIFWLVWKFAGRKGKKGIFLCMFAFKFFKLL